MFDFTKGFDIKKMQDMAREEGLKIIKAQAEDLEEVAKRAKNEKELRADIKDLVKKWREMK